MDAAGACDPDPRDPCRARSAQPPRISRRPPWLRCSVCIRGLRDLRYLKGAAVIRAAIVGMGWWGRTIVESVQSDSDVIRFVAGATRTVSPEVTAFADAQQLTLAKDFTALLADKNVDAVVLATPHSQHTEQVIAAAHAGKHVFCEKPFA